MPARAGKAIKHRSRSGPFVEMHRLRIEFGGKPQYFPARKPARAVCAEMAGEKIFEGECHNGWGLPAGKPDCGRYLWQSQPIHSYGSCLMGAPFRAVLILPETAFAATPCAVISSLDATATRFCWGERSMFEFRDL